MAAIFNAFLAIRKTFWPSYSLVNVAPQSRRTDQGSIFVSQDELPHSESYRLNPSQNLPSPLEVIDEARKQGIDITKTWRPDPVRYPEKRLIVKWGVDVTIGEGQCLWFIRRHLGHEVPVPELYGWTSHENMTFLYLELVDGEPLSERWNVLEQREKLALCEQLRSMIAAWRRIKRPTFSNVQLSQIGGQALRDIHFSDSSNGTYPAGPFSNISEFHDSYARLAIRKRSRDYGCADPRREVEELRGLTDDVPVFFTHADLDLSNILVSKEEDGPVKIVSIIDWHQSGWYPEPWEWCKAHVVAVPRSDWRVNYLDQVIDPAPENYFVSWDYVSMATI